MPELPEVETIRRSLVDKLAHQTIQSVNIYCHHFRYPIDPQLTHTLKHKTIQTIARRGKYLLIYLNQGGLICHLGMSGSLHLVTADTPRKKHDHVEIQFSDYYLRFNDPRRFGLLLASDDFSKHPLLSHLGPEPLSHAFSSAYLQQQLYGKKQSIKQAIMDNKVVVGVGNIYANEALFRAGIHPLTVAGTLNQQQCDALTKAIKVTLRRAIKAGGTTLKDFVDSAGKPGYFQQQLFVYGRDNQLCYWCDSPIKSLRIGGRNSFYCPVCQTK
ncbi:MAG: bifunctional DNA-formamidopyrimidine glycosylase/DNA-(apurinic or apyrimidinic site) lyase [Pseudomonadota bacterium]